MSRLNDPGVLSRVTVMDDIPDHIREKILGANDAVDWVTEEWFRRAVATPMTGRRVSVVRARHIRYWLNETRQVILTQFAAVTDRSRQR